MKWVPDKTGRFAQRPHYLPEELDTECERVILSFLNKKYGRVEFPIKTDDLTVFIEERADLDSYAELSGEGDHVEGVTEFLPGKRPVVRIAEELNASHLENRLRTTLTHEYGHVHFHRFMFEDLQAEVRVSFWPCRRSPGKQVPSRPHLECTRTRLDGMAGRICVRRYPDTGRRIGGRGPRLPSGEQPALQQPHSSVRTRPETHNRGRCRFPDIAGRGPGPVAKKGCSYRHRLPANEGIILTRPFFLMNYPNPQILVYSR